MSDTQTTTAASAKTKVKREREPLDFVGLFVLGLPTLVVVAGLVVATVFLIQH